MTEKDTYQPVDEDEWCKDNTIIDGRNECLSDANCLRNARKACDGVLTCFGITWDSRRLEEPLRICTSPKMAIKPDGWRTIMKDQSEGK